MCILYTYTYIWFAGESLEWADKFIYRAHVLQNDLSIDQDAERVKNGFIKQLNLLMSRFGRITSSLRGDLFKTFCTSLHGVQIVGKCVEKRF